MELRRFLGLLRHASDALQGVVVENKDCCDVVRQYARPGAVIYADPPYLEAERMYCLLYTSDIGKAHILTLHGGHMPVDELEQVDGRAEALELILNEHGTVTPDGVVYDLSLIHI